MQPTGQMDRYQGQIPAHMQFVPRMSSFIPPLQCRPADVMPLPAYPFPAVANVPQPPSRPSLKERNRVAAQKWRQKKDRCLADLEETNDRLRKQALQLYIQTRSLNVENKVLEDEIVFFQQFMAKLMSGPRDGKCKNV